MIDIQSLFEEYDIEFRTEGKNVTSGWININCPFDCPDPSFHLGVNLTSNLYHCWICGARGHIQKLTQKLLHVSYIEAKDIISEFELDIEKEEKQETHIEHVVWPKGMEKSFPSQHRDYLIRREFKPDELINKYKLRACLHLGGEFAYRIVIPIIMNSKIVSLIGRDITDKQEKKYYNLPNNQSIVHTKNCIYGIDSIIPGDKALIVEGPADKWRIGSKCGALLGMEYTPQQLYLLHQKKLKEVYVMFDGESKAIKKANKLGNILSTFIPKVRVIELSDDDPAKMSENEVLQLRKEIKL